MTVDWIYLVPHGDEIIDMPSEGGRIMNEKIRELAEMDEADSIVVISPHGLNLPENFSVVNTEYFYANTKLKTTTLRGHWKNDRPLAEKILKATRGFSEEARFVSYSGKTSRFPMDFGTSIPLHFFRKKPVVMMGQTRTADRKKLIDFGKALYDLCDAEEKHIGILLSADQAHTHSEAGPYGFSSDAKKYESVVKDCLKKGSLEELARIDDAVVKNAKPDSFWNMCAMHGMLTCSGRRTVYDYGYIEVYFGMILAHSA